MSVETIEAALRRDVAARLGEARARELAAALRGLAQEIATLEAEPLELEDGDPDHARAP